MAKNIAIDDIAKDIKEKNTRKKTSSEEKDLKKEIALDLENEEKKSSKVIKTIYVEQAVVDKISAYAKEVGLSFNQYVVKVLEKL